MSVLDVEDLDRELDWLGAIIDASIRLYFDADCAVETILEIAAPRLHHASALGKLVCDHVLTFDERIVLAIAIAPYLRPWLFDAFLLRNPHTERRFTEFGGVTGGTETFFRPTLETAAFILARASLARRIALQRILAPDHIFQREGILDQSEPTPGAFPFEMPLRLDPAFIATLTTGQLAHDVIPGSRFPARRLSTELDWDDISLAPSTLEDLQEIQAWLAHPQMLHDEPHLARHFRPGYRALFHGPPGTGKTLAAALLGKVSGLDVYRVDLSLITSKWVGETEKNLGEIFSFAERRRCILFFDEADSIFGKRSSSGSGQDRYANLEVSYLLQRIEDFSGLVVLATNIKSNIDDAFARRFQAMIYFGPPDASARLKIWRALFPDPARAQTVDLERIAADYELNGSTIVNVARHAVLLARRDGTRTIAQKHLHEGIGREYRKAGKTLAGPPR